MGSDEAKPILFRIKEAAKRLGITESTIVRLRAGRRGPRAIKLGRSVFYTEKLLQEWIEANEERLETVEWRADHFQNIGVRERHKQTQLGRIERKRDVAEVRCANAICEALNRLDNRGRIVPRDSYHPDKIRQLREIDKEKFGGKFFAECKSR